MTPADPSPGAAREPDAWPLVDLSQEGDGFHIVVAELGEHPRYFVFYCSPSDGDMRKEFETRFRAQAIAVCAALNAAPLE